MDEQMQADREQLAANYTERLAQIRQLHERAAQVTATARSRNGLIAITVGAHGEIRQVTLDDSVYQRLSPQRLGRALEELARSAAEDAAEQVRDLMAPVMPPGGLPEDADVTRLMPEPPRHPDDEAEPAGER